jgi:hypothetical protein
MAGDDEFTDFGYFKAVVVDVGTEQARIVAPENDDSLATTDEALPDDVEPATPAQTNRYKAIIERIFSDRYTQGATEVAFARVDIVTTAAALGVDLPQNLGDVVYAIRYRIPMPDAILATQP